MFSLLGRTQLAWDDATDTNGLKPHRVFGGSDLFCKTHFGSEANQAKCAAELTKGLTEPICQGIKDRYGVCVKPTQGAPAVP